MPLTLSNEQLLDISLAYSSDEILEILDIEPYDLLCILKDKVEENILEFNLRPVDCDIHDF
jgi:hypothetical protein|tara:strand:- start:2554 stop:2736 length:183 start_codon:yes stop_codon:yes gene_type:complete